jgi:hypothetical protein
MRMVYNITMGILILAVGVMMFLVNYAYIKGLSEQVSKLDPLVRYLFGGLCLLYGGFRLYRGIKKEF